ncbi:MAG TPA: AMP-binding protein, partial [Enterovirga sp.]
MDRIWVEQYPQGVPAEIDWRQYRSIGELFEKSAQAFAKRPAYSNMGSTLTFADLDRLSRQFGAWLQRKGLQRGARVA